MEVKPRALAALLVVLAVSPPALAAGDTRCYTGDASTGELTFSGAVEDTGFTGRFGDFSVRYCMPAERMSERLDAHDIRVEVRLASADSDNRDRDETLKGPEFFAVEEHPVSVWESSGVRRDGEEFVAEGELSLKAITASRSIRYELTPAGEKIVAQGRFTMAGGTRVDRQRYDVGTGEFADPEFVRNEVVIEFDVELTAQRQSPAR